jgi:hypothetical protein
MPLGLFSASAVYQNMPHCLGRGRKEMRSIPEGWLLGADELKPRFVNQCGRLKRLAGRLLGHLAGRETAQLIIYDGQQLFGAIGITAFNCFQDRRGVVHSICVSSLVVRTSPLGR